MKIFNLLVLSIGFLAATSGCSNNDSENSQENIDTGEPVESQTANTNYKPAFEGQTRVGSVTTATPFDVKIISSSLSKPWGIIGLPDGRLLITQKAGTMLIAKQSGELSTPITGLPPVNDAGQGGLLGVCIDPNFSSNKMIYWSFSEAISGGNCTSIAKGKLAEDEKTIQNVAIIYRALPAHSSTLHYGGRILFDASGNLIVSTGERSDIQTRPLAQDPSTGLGKIIRITTSGQPASGNPKFSQSNALPELYSIGHRNPQGMAIHPTTGELWESEHGPKGGDEINRVAPGKNYGWPTITYGIEYGGEKIGDGIQQKEGMEQPVYYWDPVISPSGITFYKGKSIEEWENNLFIGALSGQHIDRLVIKNNKVVGEERLLVSENQRFRDLTQGVDGALYAITDGGRLYKIDKK